MSKKKYIMPQIKTIEIESQQILAGSGGETKTLYFGDDENYEEDEISDWRDREGGIWAE